MLSHSIPLGKYPLEPYHTLAYKFLCNAFPQIPEGIIDIYMDNYHKLLVPTYLCFQKYLKEVDGVLYLNQCPITPPNPPREIFLITPDDEAFIEDSDIVNDFSKVKEYVHYYSQEVLKLLKTVVVCSDCSREKPDHTSIVCSNSHIICQECFKRMVMGLIKGNRKKLICTSSEVQNCTGEFDSADVGNILEPKQYERLTQIGVFSPVPHSPYFLPPLPPSRPPSSLPNPPSLPKATPKQPLQSKPKPKPKPKPQTIERHLRKMTLQEEEEEGYVCPITRKIMRDPVICQDGFTYERAAITQFLDVCGMSPMTFEEVDAAHFIFDSVDELRNKINEYLVYNPNRNPEL